MIFLLVIQPRILHWQITVCVHIAIKLIYQNLQCIIFKESKYNFDNTVVVEALSNRFSIPTSKEYIYKKCDKDLFAEIMLMNSVASCIRLTSNEPQQKCIHCNTALTYKFLTFDKTKYGQNTIVSQMKENDKQNIIYNKCYNAICRESLLTCLTCMKTMKKCVHSNLIWINTPHRKTTYEKWQNHRKPTPTYAKAAMYNCNKKLHVCVVTDICRNMYVKCTTK